MGWCRSRHTSAPRYLWPTLLHDRRTPGHLECTLNAALRATGTEVALHALNQSILGSCSSIAGHAVTYSSSKHRRLPPQPCRRSAPRFAKAYLWQKHVCFCRGRDYGFSDVRSRCPPQAATSALGKTRVRQQKNFAVESHSGAPPSLSDIDSVLTLK